MSDIVGGNTGLGLQENASQPAIPVPGLIEQGNITDLRTRPVVDWKDEITGETNSGTIYSITIQEDHADPSSAWVLIPTIYDGKWHTPEVAEKRYRDAVTDPNKTALHLGKFKTLEDNVAYAGALSEQQGRR